MRGTVEFEVLSSEEAAERWPDLFEMDDGVIEGFLPYTWEGDGDYYDADPENVIVFYKPGAGANPLQADIAVVTSVLPSVLKVLE